jgi:hypothetical protein
MFANKTVILTICSDITWSLNAGKKINITFVFSKMYARHQLDANITNERERERERNIMLLTAMKIPFEISEFPPEKVAQ